VDRTARYDGLADWYDSELANTDGGLAARAVVAALLGDGPGRLLDIGCGTGAHDGAFAERGWAVTGVDVSEDQLRLARERGVDVVQADAVALPFDDASFDAVVSMHTHTDVDDFAAVVQEAARVLRPEGTFVYLGVHPCFVGPHSLFVAAEGIPVLHPGYWDAGRYTDAPGISPTGLRAKVGATHLPLGLFLQTFFDSGFTLEHFEEPFERTLRREYPYMVALRARR
jgi:SAM-dependent methyltransferase